MLRVLFLGSLILNLVADPLPNGSTAADDSLTAAKFIERCHSDPGFCTDRILQTKQKLQEAREACVPDDLAPLQIGERIVAVLEEVVEGSPDAFKEGRYDILVRQVMVFLWPCESIA